jgi:5-methylcytosine-specific restriction endonuclease McrA
MAFVPQASDEEVRRERTAARALRQSAWWKQKIGRGVCYYCGSSIHPRDLTMDHLVPVIRGGRSVKGNIVAACKECNNKKKHMLPLEWDEYLSHLGRVSDEA